MKKNKKFPKATEVAENINNGYMCTVGELKNLLDHFPEHGEVTLENNIIGICANDEEVSDFIKENVNKGPLPKMEVPNNTCPEFIQDVESKDPFMDMHLYGIAFNNIDMLNDIRKTNSDTLIEGPLQTPNALEINRECELNPNQYFILDEIRAHNAYMAECLGELHRREIAALLEYNTQCLAHFGLETNKTMCDIVDNYKGDK